MPYTPLLKTEINMQKNIVKSLEKPKKKKIINRHKLFTKPLKTNKY